MQLRMICNHEMKVGSSATEKDMAASAALQTVHALCPGRGVRAAEPDHDPLTALDAARSAATAAAARDWLETQARVVEYWRDLLADAGATDELIEALEIHAAFLNGVV